MGDPPAGAAQAIARVRTGDANKMKQKSQNGNLGIDKTADFLYNESCSREHRGMV